MREADSGGDDGVNGAGRPAVPLPDPVEAGDAAGSGLAPDTAADPADEPDTDDTDDDGWVDV